MDTEVRSGYFGADGLALFGHLHAPVGGSWNGRAVVLCPPYGHEYMSAHRTLRELAQRLAHAGCLCLRMDYLGMGDSADRDAADALADLSTWPQSVVQAIEHLEALTGVGSVTLVGLRLGAAAAALAAQGRDDVEALAAWAPVVRGRAFLRECKALGMATLARTGLTAGPDDGAVQTGGFRLSPADVGFLTGLDLTALSHVPAPKVLLLARSGSAVDQAWQTNMQQLGAQVSSSEAHGLDEMMQVPHFSVVPDDALSAILAWLAALSPRSAEWRATPAHPWLRPRAELCHDGVHEHVVDIPSAAPLSAVLALPHHSKPRPHVAVLMINAGAEHRIGTNRLYVPWARTWASRGWAALRLDLSGLGNSPARAGQPVNSVHIRHVAEDIRAAMAHLQQHHGILEFHLVGLCSGGFHALMVAMEGVPLRSITPINQMVFFWQEHMPLLGAAPDAVAMHVVQGVGRSIRDPQRWLKLLRGQVHVGVIAGAMGRRLGQHGRSIARKLGRALRLTLRDDLHSAVLQLAQRGVLVHWVFSDGEPGLAMVREQAGEVVERLVEAGKLRVSVLKQTDHTFTQAAAQKRLFDVVDSGFVLARQGGYR